VRDWRRARGAARRSGHRRHPGARGGALEGVRRRCAAARGSDLPRPRPVAVDPCRAARLRSPSPVSRLGSIRGAPPLLRDPVDRPCALPQKPRAPREWRSAVAAQSCPAGGLPLHSTERPVGSGPPRWLAARRRDRAARAAWRGARAAGGLGGLVPPPAGRRTARGPAAVRAGDRGGGGPRPGRGGELSRVRRTGAWVLALSVTGGSGLYLLNLNANVLPGMADHVREKVRATDVGPRIDTRRDVLVLQTESQLQGLTLSWTWHAE